MGDVYDREQLRFMFTEPVPYAKLCKLLASFLSLDDALRSDLQRIFYLAAADTIQLIIGSQAQPFTLRIIAEPEPRQYRVGVISQAELGNPTLAAIAAAVWVTLGATFQLVEGGSGGLSAITTRPAADMACHYHQLTTEPASPPA